MFCECFASYVAGFSDCEGSGQMGNYHHTTAYRPRVPRLSRVRNSRGGNGERILASNRALLLSRDQYGLGFQPSGERILTI